MAAAGWSQDAQGKWFAIDRFGKRIYSPTTANRPHNTLLKTGAFNTATGDWERKTNWGNIVGLVAGGAALAPAAVAGVGALAAPGAAAGGAGGAGATTAGALAPTIPGSVASTAYGAGMFAAPASAGAIVPGSVAAGTHMGLSIGDWLKIAQGGGDAVLGLYGSHKQGQAASEAARLQAQGLAAQLAFERDQETRRQQEWDQQQASLKAQWDADQAWRAPYRQASASILARYTGQPAPASVAPQPLPPGYAGAPTLHPMWRPTTTLGAMAGMPPGTPIPPTAPLAAPQAIYNPNARTIGDLIAPRY